MGVSFAARSSLDVVAQAIAAGEAKLQTSAIRETPGTRPAFVLMEIVWRAHDQSIN
jgi:hypothetical protein